MGTITYTVGELKALIRESAMEYMPIKGANVDADNKKNNDKSYKDAEKAAKDYDGGLQPEKKGELPDKNDGNRTTLDYNPRTNPGDDFKDKVDAQAKGYTSKLEEENGIEKSGEFDKEGKIKKNITDASDKINDAKDALATSGIQGHNLKDKNKKRETMYEQAKPKAKKLEFKHTRFLNEAYMMERIPEEYKKDRQRIYMKDCDGNEYIVECTKSERSGMVETNVVSYKNEKKMNEQMERIQQLFGYETEKEFAPATASERIEESRRFQEIMDLSRNLSK